jgi:hypothetical protein
MTCGDPFCPRLDGDARNHEGAHPLPMPTATELRRVAAEVAAGGSAWHRNEGARIATAADMLDSAP